LVKGLPIKGRVKRKNTSKELGGSGLGLSIVKHIIEGHGETVSVESEVRKGSRFAFTLSKVQELG